MLKGMQMTVKLHAIVKLECSVVLLSLITK